MKGVAGTSAVALAVAGFLASLSLVSWRQREALATSDHLEVLREECRLEMAKVTELEDRIRTLKSRGRVVLEAERRLGMRRAAASDIVYLPGEEA